MANSRRVYRKYAQYKGKEAKEFVEIEEDWYDEDTLVTKDSEGNLERTCLRYKDFVHWVINNNKKLFNDGK